MRKVFTYDIFKSLPLKKDDALLIDLSIWPDILTEDRFIEISKPVLSRETIVTTGLLGTLNGVPIFTDAFFENPFLKKGTVYLANEVQITSWICDQKIPEEIFPVFSEE